MSELHIKNSQDMAMKKTFKPVVPRKRRILSVEERHFLYEYALSGNQAKAATLVFKNVKPSTAHSKGCKLLDYPEAQEELTKYREHIKTMLFDSFVSQSNSLLEVLLERAKGETPTSKTVTTNKRGDTEILEERYDMQGATETILKLTGLLNPDKVGINNINAKKQDLEIPDFLISLLETESRK